MKKVKTKISLLTLLPDHWKFEQANHYFQCSRYLFNKAKKLVTGGRLKNWLLIMVAI